MSDRLRTVHFVSLGCAKNRVDTEVMVGVAEGAGLDLVGDAEEADVVVINTCGFIGEAKKESIDTILEVADMRDSGRGRMKKLVVAGCLSQRYADELAKEIPEVDHFMGSSDMLKLGDVLAGAKDRMLVGNPAEWVYSKSDPRVLSLGRHFAYVKVAEGCNRSCSFCVIPDMRGKQRSRGIDDVVAEVEQLVAQGVREVNLISQDTISWGRDLPGSGGDEAARGRKLAELVERVAEVKGLSWVRLFYLYPETIDPKLIELLAQHPRVMPYVDMPLQHASDAMLKRMKRGHGIDRQRRVVEKLRKSIPELTFRTAFIVGHPGETDAEFEELLEFVKWAEFERLAAFRYSDEETCASFELPGKVPAKVAAQRYRRLMKTQKAIAHKKSKAMIGQELEVLVEGTSDEHEYVQMARHRGQAPEVDGQVYLEGPEVEDARAAELRRVVITQAADYDVVGELLPRSEGEAATARRRAQLTARRPRVTLPVIGNIEGR
ncbi:MAG: 30S ribosomal protein S12 methylthiotransferase RimO [Deltaproteobacteria bacterium]|nr:30S ribosomal protein S12 methylthiotransferase RimO [Deltaproteobacteria bacterium]